MQFYMVILAMYGILLIVATLTTAYASARALGLGGGNHISLLQTCAVPLLLWALCYGYKQVFGISVALTRC